MGVEHVVYEADRWGVGELVVENDRVVWHELPWPRPRPLPAGSSAPGRGIAPDRFRTPTHPGYREVVSRQPSRCGGGFATDVVRLVQAFLAGTAPPDALVEVPVDLEYGTPFLSDCAAALRAVPGGEVVTYGELAALAGAPGAARAAGSFCARNRLGLFVPCHRVVSASGLGSYGSFGVAYKRRLLELEGAL